jgi:hypothetical protein
MDACDLRGDDSDCDGTPNSHCPCVEGQTQQCGSQDTGACEFGQSVCDSGRWSPCNGEVPTALRDCTSAADNDCDGSADNELDGPPARWASFYRSGLDDGAAPRWIIEMPLLFDRDTAIGMIGFAEPRLGVPRSSGLEKLVVRLKHGDHEAMNRVSRFAAKASLEFWMVLAAEEWHLEMMETVAESLQYWANEALPRSSKRHARRGP